MKVDSARSVEPRILDAIARRALVLGCVYGRGIGIEQNVLMTWLEKENLLPSVTPREVHLLEAAVLTEKERIDASWLSESIVVLLWSIGIVAKLPPNTEECDPAAYLNLMPPFTEDMSSEWFLRACYARPAAELFEVAEVIQQTHWQVREWMRKREVGPPPAHPGVIQERHRAINWVTGYEALEWDDVTTDT